jgi:hypothetical protein
MYGAGEGTDETDIPMSVKNKPAKYTPFISNAAKEIYARKFVDQNQGEAKTDNKPNNFSGPGNHNGFNKPNTSAPPGGKPQFDGPKKSYNVGLGPTNQGNSQNQPQPTFRLEMYPEPKDQRAPPFVPTAGTSSGALVKVPQEPKIYNINLPGPTGGHVEMKKIYEHVLPGKEGRFTSTTLGERLQMYDYIKQILIQVNDGEEIGLDYDGHRSLLSYIKFMELNPTHYSPILNNPYSSLPLGLLIYRSCFPIKLDQMSQQITCAKDSIGLNIRLYALNIAEFFAYKFRQPFYIQYDVWRELAWYEYIREQIIKKKISPNFTLLYAFFLSPNRKIDFYSLKGHTLTQKDLITKEYEKFRVIHTYVAQNVKEKLGIQVSKKIPLTDVTQTYYDQLPDEIDPELRLYSGNLMIMITEAPNSNIYQWASKEFERNGIVEKMSTHGFHDERVWLSILFQIVSAMYVMQLHGLYIKSMTLKDNFYIKDLKTTIGKASGYWKYIIDGLTYYIPNYGYLVMVDSNFKDIIPMTTTLDRYSRKYKLYMDKVYGIQHDAAELRLKIYENFKGIINTNNFTKEHTRNNVTRPPETVMGLMERIMTDPQTDIGTIIQTHFMNFLNNRIGTLLKKDQEIPNLRDLTLSIKNGELIPMIIEENVFKWCIYIGKNPSGTANVISRTSSDTKDYRVEQVSMNVLKQYAPSEKIEQIFDKDINFSDEYLLETYIISP